MDIQRLFELGEEFDIILLAPQIHHLQSQLEAIFPDKLILNIPTNIFATYNIAELLTFIKEKKDSVKKTESIYPQIFPLQSYLHNQEHILCLSLFRNQSRIHISYRLFYPHYEMKTSGEIIKNKINIDDIFDVIDTMLVQDPNIEKVGVSVPGIIYNNHITSTGLPGLSNLNLNLFYSKYKQTFYFNNDVNTTAVGFYATQEKYHSLAALFQTVGFGTGAGIIINGKLINGNTSIAGEVQYLPLQLSQDEGTLRKTIEGSIELVSKYCLSIISIINPEAIAFYCSLLPDPEDLRNELKKSLPEEHIPDLIKIHDMKELNLIGQYILCTQ